MIFDTITNIDTYKGINKYLDIAIEYLKTYDLRMLASGKHEIDGDNVFVNLVETELMMETSNVYEFHEKYLDLHIDVEGNEGVCIAKKRDGLTIKDYDEDADYGLVECKDKVGQCCIDATHFCICMPGELHMPLVKVDANSSVVKKAIFKIKY